MRVRRITVRNFRNLRHVELFPRKTALIVGENNTGKTNLLHVLRLLFDVQADRLRLDLSEEDINDAALTNGEKWFSISVELGELQAHPELEAVFKDRIDQDGDETYVTIEGRYEVDTDGILTWTSTVLPPHERFNDPLPLSIRMQRLLPLYFLEASRDAQRDTRATGVGFLAKLLNEVDFSDVQDQVQERLRDANLQFRQSPDISNLSSGLSQQLTPHIPGGVGTIKLAVANEDISGLGRGIHLRVSKSAGENDQNIFRHGTGLQNLTLIAIYRYLAANDNKGQPILAIEEPEAHLHPHTQRRLFKDLSSIETPVFMTTHSPAIVERANPLDIIRLRNNGQDNIKACQLKEADLSEGDRKQLAQLMRNGRADIFFARSVLIVEGECEAIAIREFAEFLNSDLDRDGVSIVISDSNSYAYIIRACQRFEIPFVVTYDKDVLQHDNKLLKEAFKSDLISQGDRDACSSNTAIVAASREAVLTRIGWIGATNNFEEEVCSNGYLDQVLQAIQTSEHSGALAEFASRHGKAIADLSTLEVTQFIAKHKNLKVMLARAIANVVRAVGQVPACYETAIRRAIAIAV